MNALDNIRWVNEIKIHCEYYHFCVYFAQWLQVNQNISTMLFLCYQLFRNLPLAVSTRNLEINKF
jgi:hypothetical protein